MKELIYTILALVVIVIFIVLIFKFPNTRKALLYILGTIIIACGAITGTLLYKEMTAESYINGSIDVSNQFSQESFKYSSTSVVFYDDIYDNKDLYTFSTELLKVENFDGIKNKYEVEINDYILLEPNLIITAGAVSGQLPMEFYDLDGNVDVSAVLNLSIQFLSNKTVLTLSVEGYEPSQYMEQYFADNGIRITVNQIME